MLHYIGTVLLITSLAAIATIFVAYPLILCFVKIIHRRPAAPARTALPSVSVLVVARNAETLMEEKLRQTLAVTQHLPDTEIIVYSDGSTDSTAAIAGKFAAQGVRVFSSGQHLGKNHGLTVIGQAAKNDILVLTDVNSRLAEDALETLLPHFTDTGVGGVCGRIVITKQTDSPLGEAQRLYFNWDSWIKILESRTGGICSNNGKLSAVRRELFQPVATGTTDDFYICLNSARQGRPFVYEPRARAYIREPSRSDGHEIQRRMRIVLGSLTTIVLMRELLNPVRHGLFACKLFVNKILRRLLPFFLLGAVIGLGLMGSASPGARAAFGLLAAGIVVAAVFPWLAGPIMPGRVRSLGMTAHYFLVANMAMGWAVVRFLMGKRQDKWNPATG